MQLLGLLVINCNIGLILSCFRDIASFLLRRATPPLFHPNFGVFSLDEIADVVGPSHRPYANYSLINLELVQPICPWYVNVTDRQTDGRTDGRLKIVECCVLCVLCVLGSRHCRSTVDCHCRA